MSEEQSGSAVAEAPVSASSENTPTPESSASERIGIIRPSSNSVDLTKSMPQNPGSDAPAKPDKPEDKVGQAGDGKTTPEGKKEGQGQKPPEEKPQGIDEQYAEMLKAQGFDPSKIVNDPTSLNKLLNNYSNMQREFTKKAQAEKTAAALKEAQSILPPAQGEKPPKIQSPIDVYEDSFNYMMQAQLAARGVQSIDELWQKDPAAAHYYESQYVKGRQKAFEENVAWQQTQAAQRLKEEGQKIQYQNDLRDAENFTVKNIAEARKNLPDLEAHFKNTGIEDFLRHLEDHYTIPRTFILSDKKWVDFFVKAAHAMNTVGKMDAHDKEVVENYKKALAKQGQATLPSGTGGGETELPPENDQKPSAWRNSQGRGVRL